jgi:hypothetical protein
MFIEDCSFKDFSIYDFEVRSALLRIGNIRLFLCIKKRLYNE